MLAFHAVVQRTQSVPRCGAGPMLERTSAYNSMRVSPSPHSSRKSMQRTAVERDVVRIRLRILRGFVSCGALGLRDKPLAATACGWTGPWTRRAGRSARMTKRSSSSRRRSLFESCLAWGLRELQPAERHPFGNEGDLPLDTLSHSCIPITLPRCLLMPQRSTTPEARLGIFPQPLRRSTSASWPDAIWHIPHLRRACMHTYSSKQASRAST